MFFTFPFGLLCLTLFVSQCEAKVDSNQRDQLKHIFESLENNKHNDHLINSWFPIGIKIMNKIGEMSKKDQDYKRKNKYRFDYNVDKLPFKQDNVCRTKECYEAGLLVQSNLNESVNPCDDFYEFSCGGWIAKHQIPNTSSQFSQFDLVGKTLQKQLKEILESDAEVTDPLPVKAAQVAYKACIDEETIEQQGIEPLTSVLNSLGTGGWPITQQSWDPSQLDMTELFVQVTRRWNIHHLVYVSVQEDRVNSTRNIITIDQGSPILPRSMLIDPDSYPDQIEAYSEWILGTALALSADSNRPDPSTVKIDVHDMIKFEMKFANLTTPSEMRRDHSRLQNLISLAHLTEWTNSAASTERSKINWVALVNGLFNGTGMSIDETEIVNVEEFDYLFRLVRLIEETPPKVIANYVIWHVVQALAYESTNHLRQLTYDFQFVYMGSNVSEPRWQDCVNSINELLGFAVGFKYVKRHFNDQHKKEVQSLIANMKVVLKSRLSSLSWMDSETRSAALDKLEAMHEFIGYPEWYNNSTYFNEYFTGISVSQDNHLYNVESLLTYKYMKALKTLYEINTRDEWQVNPAEVNAYNDIGANSIIFPAGILQPPFFSLSQPEALNYGSIGIVIGHEIMHGFDDMGRQNDKFGNLVQWWSHQTLQTYKKKAACFVKQYGRFRIPQLDVTLNKPVTANGVRTQGENIADNGGLEMAYLAYKKYVMEKEGKELRLPGVEKYSPEQLFFIGYGSNWCEAVSKESLLSDYLTEDHSVQRLRVIGAVSNSEYFARAFNCKLGSAMNPVDKCSIW
uniref:Neprilysin-11 n=1 Tax=Cacopsylla melanoneura TaxID=428564 RepID=A0A8D9DX90_9HEMI